MDYIRFEQDIPILKQVPEFKSAAFLLHPFIQMPEGWWEEQKRQAPYKHIYPNEEEILALGKGVSWEEVRQRAGFNSLDEIGIALASNALKTKYARIDLQEKLSSAFSKNFFWPIEDRISILLCEGIIRKFKEDKVQHFYFADPIEDNKGEVAVANCNPLIIPDLAAAEVLIISDDQQSVFLSQYDQSSTLFLSKEPDLSKVIEKYKWEAIVCDRQTLDMWFLQESSSDK